MENTMYNIIRCGYNAKHSKDFLMSRPNGLYCYLFLIVKSPASFQINDRPFTIHSTSAVLISPNTPYQYSGLDCEYKNDWLYFTCENNDFESKCGSLFNHPIPLSNGPQFSQYFQQIIWENHYALEQFRVQNVSMLFEIIFNKLLQEEQTTKAQTYNPYISQLQKLRLYMLSMPNHNFTPSELADRLHISPSYFQFLYKDYFGIPFKTDLINMRLAYAKSLIIETALPFEEIAFQCGYSNEIHFYRQFKAKTGMTPREYRMSVR